MKMVRYLIFGTFLWVFFVKVNAQDLHLSQAEASPLFLNPAMGGEYFGDWRVGNSYREQWRSIDKPFRSYVLFFDRKFYYYSQNINVGALYIHDRSGNADLSAEKFYFNFSCPITQGRSRIVAGLQPGIVYKYYTDDLTYPEQYDHSTGYFNKDLPNNETSIYGNTRRTYFDLNAGILWKMTLPKIRPSFGFSLMHLNRPKDSFNSLSDKTGIRENIHAQAVILMKNDLYLKPYLVSSIENKAHEILVGSDVGKKFPSKTTDIREVYAGLYLRNGINRNYDAFIGIVGVQYQRCRVGMSYDINYSDLSEASGYRGAFEISVIYSALSSSPKQTSIPCDRY